MAFLGIKISHEIGRLLSSIEIPGEKEDSSELHTTIIFFQKEWPISEVSKSLDAIYGITSETAPFTIKIDKISSFPTKNNEPCPIIAKVKSEELKELQKKISKELDKSKVEHSKLYDYNPHITLAYHTQQITDFSIDPIEFSVQELVLWCGDHGDDRIFVTFPLKNPKSHHKNALLLQKTELFNKLSASSQTHFTATSNRRKTSR